MSYKIVNPQTNEVLQETPKMRAAQNAVIVAWLTGKAAVIWMCLPNGKHLIMSKMSEVRV